MSEDERFDQALSELRRELANLSEAYATLGEPEKPLGSVLKSQRPTVRQVELASWRRLIMARQLEELLVFAQRARFFSESEPLLELRDALIELNRGCHEWLLAPRRKKEGRGRPRLSTKEQLKRRLAVALTEKLMREGVKIGEAVLTAATMFKAKPADIVTWRKQARAGLTDLPVHSPRNR